MNGWHTWVGGRLGRRVNAVRAMVWSKVMFGHGGQLSEGVEELKEYRVQIKVQLWRNNWSYPTWKNAPIKSQRDRMMGGRITW